MFRHLTKTLGLALVAALAVSAVAVATASASLTIAEAGGTALKTPASIKGFSTNLTFKTSSGNLECKENTLEGMLLKNGSSPAEGEIEKGLFTGTGGGECPTTFPFKPTAAITAEGFNWIMKGEKLNTTEAEVTIEEGLSGPLAFTAVIKGFGTCKFEAKSMKGKALLKASPLTMTLNANQTMTSKSGGVCPTSGTLEGTFTLTSSGKALEAN